MSNVGFSHRLDSQNGEDGADGADGAVFLCDVAEKLVTLN